MSERRSIEIIAETVDEAVRKGLAELGANPWDVMVEILEEPSYALFDQPARKAKVRLQMLRSAAPPMQGLPRLAQPDADARKAGSRPSSAPTDRPTAAPSSGERRAERPDRGPRPERSDRGGRPGRDGSRDSAGRGRDGGRSGGRNGGRGTDPNRPVSRLLDQTMGRGGRGSYGDDDSLYDDLEDEAESLFSGYTSMEDDVLDSDVTSARDTLVDLLKLMDISGSVQISRVDAQSGSGPWILNVQGQGGRSINQLIGRRGDTLNALQYILRLMVSHKQQHRVNLIVDVEAYKARRAERLRALAQRMAEQALSEGRTIVMEPMPPHERRLVHIALRHHPDVDTRSVGEGEARKVTIVPNAKAKPVVSAEEDTEYAEDLADAAVSADENTDFVDDSDDAVQDGDLA